MKKFLILGGGSNTLFVQDQMNCVVHLGIKGKEIVEQNGDQVIVKVGAGENWHEFVLWSVENDFGGVENLSLIPGSVGAAPIQNIGAYGVELQHVFHSLTALQLNSGQEQSFNVHDCQFDYRNSIFKSQLKNQFLITHVYMSLTRRNHRFTATYGKVEEMIQDEKKGELSVKNLSDVIVRIRQSKLPDPVELGNSGSFFKNAIVSSDTYIELQKSYPDLKHSKPLIEHTRFLQLGLSNNVGGKVNALVMRECIKIMPWF